VSHWASIVCRDINGGKKVQRQEVSPVVSWRKERDIAAVEDG
jgi:hypothetical protein